MPQDKIRRMFDPDKEPSPKFPLMEKTLLSVGSCGVETSNYVDYQQEEEKREILLDLTQLILDLTGTVEPTFISDGTNALISLARGNWLDVLISTVSIVPYIGDLAKLGKLRKYSQSIRKAIKIAEKDGVWKTALKNFLERIKKLIDELVEILGDKVPNEILQIKSDIESFLPSRLKNGKGPGYSVSKESRERFRPQDAPKKTRKARRKEDDSRDTEDGIITEGGVKNTKPLAPRARHGENGRLESVFTKVEKHHIGKGTPTTAEARDHIRVLGKQTDDAGHAIGKNLGGKGGKTSGNIFPQSPSVNRGAFSQFEKQVAKEVKAGKEVFTKVTPKYKPGATRPHEIVYQVRVNGKTTSRTFPNP